MLLYSLVLLAAISIGAYAITAGHVDSGGWVHDWDGKVYRVDVLDIVIEPNAATSTLASLDTAFGVHVMGGRNSAGLYWVSTNTRTRQQLWTLRKEISTYPGVSDVIFDYAPTLN